MIKYPRDWITEDNTQVFSEGDLFSVKIIGKSQKTSTELYDDAGLTIGVPIETNKDLLTWVKEYYPIKNINDKPNVFTEEKIGLLHFQKVYTCGLGCFTYYNIKHNNNVYKIMIFAEGPNKSNYLTILNLMLSTFKFFGFQISPTSLVESTLLSTSTSFITSTHDSVADWKNYTNALIFFKYPPNWIYEKYSIEGKNELHGIVQLQPENKKSDSVGIPLAVSYWDNSEGLTIEQYDKKINQGAAMRYPLYDNQAQLISLGNLSAL